MYSINNFQARRSAFAAPTPLSLLRPRRSRLHVPAPRCELTHHPRVAAPPCKDRTRKPLPLPKRPTVLPDEMPVEAPQHATADHRAHRQAHLRSKRLLYQWSYDAIDGAALIDTLPASEMPSRKWVVMMKRITDRCQKNTDAIEAASSIELQSDERMQLEELADPFLKYKKQFITVDVSDVVTDNQFLTDEIFARYRVAGPNPMQLELFRGSITDFFPDLDDTILHEIPHFEEDSLESICREKRLFIVDYARLSAIPTGNFADGTRKDGLHLYAPLALFAVPKKQTDRVSLLPIAIRCSQDALAPTFTPNRRQTSAGQWQAAKTTVQVADAFVHETVYHFAHTHLLMEVFVCATHRALPPSHPVFRLLNCHFEGTAFINDSSLKNLICSGGLIDCITAPSIEDTQRLAAESLVSDFSFNDAMPDVELRARGVCETSDGELVLNFPYRDDALLLWNCILQWVGDYISAFYISDDDVVNDYELQNWGEEIVTHGRIKGFGEPHGTARSGKWVCSKEYLRRVIAMVMFTGSVQHAAVNFPQSTHMQFAPAMPLAGYAEAPTMAKGGDDSDELAMHMMPNLHQAQLQLCAAEMLGVGRYTRLGEYGRHLDFAGAAVQEGLLRFRHQLSVIESGVERRSEVERAAGLPAYDFLAPSKIPQSINV